MSLMIRKDGQPVTNLLRQKLQEKYGRTPQASALLLDTSGSMIGTRITKLRELAQGLREFRRFVFSDGCKELPAHHAIEDPEGGTSMHTAFEAVKLAGIQHIVLITDGEPDSEDLALKASKGLRIDIYYVGDPPAPPFLADLAGHTGGKYGETTITKELENKCRGLLAAAPPEAIQL